MAKYVCSICGYVYEGDAPPEECPICKAPAEKFIEQSGGWSFQMNTLSALPKASTKKLSKVSAKTLTANAAKLACILQ